MKRLQKWQLVYTLTLLFEIGSSCPFYALKMICNLMSTYINVIKFTISVAFQQDFNRIFPLLFYLCYDKISILYVWKEPIYGFGFINRFGSRRSHYDRCRHRLYIQKAIPSFFWHRTFLRSRSYARRCCTGTDPSLLGIWWKIRSAHFCCRDFCWSLLLKSYG